MTEVSREFSNDALKFATQNRNLNTVTWTVGLTVWQNNSWSKNGKPKGEIRREGTNLKLP